MAITRKKKVARKPKAAKAAAKRAPRKTAAADAAGAPADLLHTMAQLRSAGREIADRIAAGIDERIVAALDALSDGGDHAKLAARAEKLLSRIKPERGRLKDLERLDDFADRL